MRSTIVSVMLVAVMLVLAVIAGAYGPAATPAPPTGDTTHAPQGDAAAVAAAEEIEPAIERRPRVWAAWYGGSAGTPMGCYSKLIDHGWGWYAGHRLSYEFHVQPDAVMVHLPWCSIPGDMTFDSLQWAKGHPELARVFDESAFVAAFTMYRQMLPHTEIWFYVGFPEASTELTRLWEARQIGAWKSRVRASIRPILRLQEHIGPVGIIVDVAGYGYVEGTQTHLLMTYLEELGVGRLGVEPRINYRAAGANRADWIVVTMHDYWRRSDPDRHADARGRLMRNSELLGEQVIFITAPGEAGRTQMLSAMREGWSVMGGVWPGSAIYGSTAGQLKRQAARPDDARRD